MPLTRFTDMPSFERAIAEVDSDMARFTLTPQVAAEWLGLSRRHVHQLVRSGALDAAIVSNAYVFLDPVQVEDYRTAVRSAPKEERKRLRREWIRARSVPDGVAHAAGAS